MGLKKWIQRRVCNGMWVVMTHIDKDVIEEFADYITKQAEIHECACREGHEAEGMYHAPAQVQDHECGCMTVEKLRNVEQEWIERGIIN